MSAETKFAIVGAGVMGTNHARVISNSPNASVQVVVDLFEASGRRLADQHGAQWVKSAAEIPEGLAVVVASATESHFEIAESLIKSGHPVLIEKPLTASLEETKELLRLSEEHNTVLMCGLLERFNPAILTAKNLIREPHHINAVRHSPFTPRIKTHVAWDLMIHDMDLVIGMFGSAPESVFSASANRQSENGVADVTESVLSFGRNRIASVSASRTGHRKIRMFSVCEDDRLFEIDLLRRNVTVYHNVQESPLGDGLGYKQESIIEIPELISSTEPLTAQLQHFLHLLEDSQLASIERESILPAHNAILEVVEAATKS